MQRLKGTSAAVALVLLTAACAEDAAANNTDPPQPPALATETTAAPTTTQAPEPPDRAQPGPIVRLSNGESVPVFEAFDHANFGDPTTIDNPWLPMVPGTRLVYEGFTREDGEVIPHRLVFVVTDLVKTIDGVPSLVRWDVDYSAGDLVETEIAFYAQDDDGTVWRMGEYPEEWEEGEFIDAPSWIAGVADARAGIAMPANPRLETASYSQGWGPAVGFSDRAYVYEMGLSTCVRIDCYDDVLVMDEFNDEEPEAHQLKYYARGIGNIQVGWRGDDQSIEELELVEVTQLTPEELAEVRETALNLEERAYILDENVYGSTERAR